MQRFTNILFIADPYGAASTALQQAIELARSNKAKLTLSNVNDELPKNLLKMHSSFLKLQKAELESLLSKFHTDGLDINIQPLIGTPFLEIIKEVARNNYDLVIKPTEGRSGLSKILFGTTDMHLLRKCPCPVWLIKPTRKQHFSRILAAVDPDPQETTNKELNALILDLATSLSRTQNSELHIMHAWSMRYESSLRSGHVRISKKEVDSMVRDTRNRHKKWLDNLLEQYNLNDLTVKVHLVKGKPGEAISNLAKKKHAELIVMGTVARTGIPGYLIGNTAEKILTEVDCSILAVKPESFLTPVKTNITNANPITPY